MTLVECVPNISEGRDDAVIAAVRAAITLPVLDQHTDPDHNRTVFTFAGAPSDVTEAAFRLVEAAAQHIDLRQHEGVHPRIGAADVVPLIPLRGLDMVACGELARGLAQRISMELDLPTYLYDYAHPQGRPLPATRRKGYEWLRTAITAEHPPDFGPKRVGSAGAVAVGARKLLVAFNVYLQTNDAGTARAIARIIRETGGGMHGVRALGMMVAGRAQVSMNLIDPLTTGPAPVVARIRELAAQHGTAIDHSELVGLIPEGATGGHESWQLEPPLGPERILERVLP